MTHLQEILRPHVWDALMGLDQKVIGSKTQKQVLRSLSESGHVRILMFVGPPGTGKTSAARLFSSTYLGCSYKSLLEDPSYKEINASGERGIDVIRELAANYISIQTDTFKCRIIVFDEADGLTYQAQEALKAITQDYAHNCIFIFCLNKFYRMDEALVSRSAIFYFDPIGHDIAVKWLLSQAPKVGISIPLNVAHTIIDYYRGDLRRVANNFLDVYRDSDVTQWKPRPTHAEEIFASADPQEKYLEIAAKEFLDPDELLKELLILNKHKNPAIFGQAAMMLKNADPIFAILYALTGIEKK